MVTRAHTFGRDLMRKLAQGHQPRPLAAPKPPATPGIQQAPTSFMQSWMNPPKPSSTSGAPTNSPFINTLDRWYNPWTKQTGRERGEQGLMRAGQTAMGVGAAAGAAAGGLAAAAPAVGNMAVSSIPGAIGSAVTGGAGTTTAGVGGAATAGSQTPAGQNLLQRGGQMLNQAMPAAQNMMNRANQVVNTYDTRVKPVLDRVGYKPTELALDGYAAATGNFDKIKGPGWATPGGMKMPEAPLGAPKLPRPVEAWKGLTAAGANVLPRPMASALGFKPPATAAGGLMRQ